MSAPETNIDKQTKRHSAPLMGIALAVGAGILAIAAWLTWSADEGNTPRDATPEGGVIAPEGN
ncbi:hypothetical protein KUV47_08440 [Vannielia litorea]|uniref:hypothetical protein n=1 Tax=Vannielia TaxID=2813041 RepID=UPI001C93D511|nr:hypothetical protein [Vannielia litorea]MBY6046849.1 hypothetical protein [Vannielia litorea]MBY6074263.1 hypothetical protein [Vannielia litorea]MBY6153236.1 hypothetical protein [Vannielia litorea]